jgi:hypothetical protein
MTTREVAVKGAEVREQTIASRASAAYFKPLNRNINIQ